MNANAEYVDTGLVKEAGYDIRNAEDKVYGRATMTKVLEDSSNTGVILVERQVEMNDFENIFVDLVLVRRRHRTSCRNLWKLRHLENTRRSIEFFDGIFWSGYFRDTSSALNSYQRSRMAACS